MVPLRRLRKKRALAPLLERTSRMLGAGWMAAVVDAADPMPPSISCAEALRQNGVLLGYLVCIPPADLPDAARDDPAKRDVARFAADCLETLLDGEALRRSLAAETLVKYREVSLLHRATTGLNASLRPREVARALLDECRRGELPADCGMVFLHESADAPFLPACSFGDTPSRRLADISGSALFAAVRDARKGEIINDLPVDQRWAGEADVASLLLYPLLAAGKCVGMLVLGGPAPMLFEASHLQHIGILAAVAGIDGDHQRAHPGTQRRPNRRGRFIVRGWRLGSDRGRRRGDAGGCRRGPGCGRRRRGRRRGDGPVGKRGDRIHGRRRWTGRGRPRRGANGSGCRSGRGGNRRTVARPFQHQHGAGRGRIERGRDGLDLAGQIEKRHAGSLA